MVRSPPPPLSEHTIRVSLGLFLAGLLVPLSTQAQTPPPYAPTEIPLSTGIATNSGVVVNRNGDIFFNGTLNGLDYGLVVESGASSTDDSVLSQEAANALISAIESLGVFTFSDLKMDVAGPAIVHQVWVDGVIGYLLRSGQQATWLALTFEPADALGLEPPFLSDTNLFDEAAGYDVQGGYLVFAEGPQTLVRVNSAGAELVSGFTGAPLSSQQVLLQGDPERQVNRTFDGAWAMDPTGAVVFIGSTTCFNGCTQVPGPAPDGPLFLSVAGEATARPVISVQDLEAFAGPGVTNISGGLSVAAGGAAVTFQAGTKLGLARGDQVTAIADIGEPSPLSRNYGLFRHVQVLPGQTDQVVFATSEPGKTTIDAVYLYDGSAVQVLADSAACSDISTPFDIIEPPLNGDHLVFCQWETMNLAFPAAGFTSRVALDGGDPLMLYDNATDNLSEIWRGGGYYTDPITGISNVGLSGTTGYNNTLDTDGTVVFASGGKLYRLAPAAIEPPRPEGADLALSGTATADSGSIDFSLTLQNLGPDDVDDYSVVVTFPSSVTVQGSPSAECRAAGGVTTTTMTCSEEPFMGAALQANESKTFTFRVAVGEPGPFEATATVSTSANDSKGDNDTLVLTTTIQETGAVADMAITGITRDNSGDLVITVANNGPDEAANVVVTIRHSRYPFVAPPDLGFGFQCVEQPTEFDYACMTATMAAGESFELNPVPDDVFAIPDNGPTASVTAFVSSDASDPVSTNNAGTVDLQIDDDPEACASVAPAGPWLWVVMLLAFGLVRRRRYAATTVQR